MLLTFRVRLRLRFNGSVLPWLTKDRKVRR